MPVCQHNNVIILRNFQMSELIVFKEGVYFAYTWLIHLTRNKSLTKINLTYQSCNITKQLQDTRTSLSKDHIDIFY